MPLTSKRQSTSLSQDVTELCTASDLTVLPLFPNACEHFTPLSKSQQEAMIADAAQSEPLFA